MQIEVNDIQRTLLKNALSDYRNRLERGVRLNIGSEGIVSLLKAQAELRTIEDQLESEAKDESVHSDSDPNQ
jgi:hypothetical protein